MAVVIFVLGSCTQSPVDPGPIADPGRAITPVGNDRISLVAETGGLPETNGPALGSELKVRLPDEYIPSQALMANLDFDENEEQIIVFKRRDDPDDLIRLLVVTYDSVRNAWIRSWEGVTNATSTRSFTVYTDDLVGDHEQEIVAFGINSRGEQTLDVFRRTSDALGFGLSYTRILSIEADITIRVESVPRSEAYEAMATVSAPSYPVIAERRDPESRNDFDAVRTTYFWDYPSRRYVAGLVESVSGEAVQDDRLRALFAGTEANFEQFLHGPWFRSSDAGDLQIAYFGARDRSVVFHSRDLQQAFMWANSTKPVYGRGVQLIVVNENLQTVKRLINVTVQGVNEITVAIQGSDGLGGTYARLTGPLQASIVQNSQRAVLSAIGLSGVYRGDLGREIVFSGSEYRFRQGSNAHSGGFALFDLGEDTILTLRAIDENRLPVKTLTFRAVFEEGRESDRITRSLHLEPGDVGIAGFFDNGSQRFTVEQIETIERDDG
ncbi:MAG: hypothetical protein EA382_10365 [Spirochaetaceae bacterium]|nr:MAG: hypothetical protein EA382_10365 [Spirochaetaceae bacterium]